MAQFDWLMNKMFGDNILKCFVLRFMFIDSSNAVLGMAFTHPPRKGDSVLYCRDELCTAYQTKQNKDRRKSS